MQHLSRSVHKCHIKPWKQMAGMCHCVIFHLRSRVSMVCTHSKRKSQQFIFFRREIAFTLAFDLLPNIFFPFLKCRVCQNMVQNWIENCGRCELDQVYCCSSFHFSLKFPKSISLSWWILYKRNLSMLNSLSKLVNK